MSDVSKLCRYCFRPIAQHEDWESHPAGCECDHCTSLCWGDNCEDRRDERIEELEKALRKRDWDLAEAGALIMAHEGHIQMWNEKYNDVERLQYEKELLLAAIADRYSVEDWNDPSKGITELEAHLAVLKEKDHS